MNYCHLLPGFIYSYTMKMWAFAFKQVINEAEIIISPLACNINMNCRIISYRLTSRGCVLTLKCPRCISICVEYAPTGISCIQIRVK